MPMVATHTRNATAGGVLITLSSLAACNDSGGAPTGVIVGPPSTIEVLYCAGLQPDWVAFDDGDGSWAQAQPTPSGNRIVIRHTFTTDRGAMAAVRTFRSGLTTLLVQYAQPAELAAFGDTIPSHCGSTVSSTLVGSVVGLGTGDFAAVNAGFGSRDIVPIGTRGDAFELASLIPGPQEILATRTSRPLVGTSVLTSTIIRRTPTLPDGATLPPFDFNSSEAFAPVVANLTIIGLGAEGASSVTRLRTAHGDSEISFLTSSETAPTRTFYAIPGARLEPADLHLLAVTAHPTDGHTLRSAAIYFHSPVDQTLRLGVPAIAPAFSTVATTPALRLRARFVAQNDYDHLASISYQQGLNTVVSVGMTAARAALDATGYDLVVPDLSRVAGFDARWALRAGEPVSWTATRTGGTVAPGFNVVTTNGATTRTGIAFDSFTP